MQVTFKRACAFSFDGRTVSNFEAGDTADVPDEHATDMVNRGDALETKGCAFAPSDESKGDTEATVKKKGKK